MPIQPFLSQQRFTPVGQIRLGVFVAGKGTRPHPEKLDRFRFTSAARPLLVQVADRYGGQVVRWQPQGGGPPAWQVVSRVDRVPVIVPPRALSQYMETWSRGGLQRRCDGVTEQLSGRPCPCRRDRDRTCTPNTRLSVLLTEIEGLGTWRLWTRGWDAAAELPPSVEAMARLRAYFEATLYLRRRSKTVRGQTRHWMVPALEIRGVTPAILTTAAPSAPASSAPASFAAEPSAAAAPPPSRAPTTAPQQPGTVDRPRARSATPGDADTAGPAAGTGLLQAIQDASTPEAARLLMAHATATDHPKLDQLSAAAEHRIQMLDQQAAQLWEQICRAWPGDDLTRLQAAFAAGNDGIHPGSASIQQLTGFLQTIRDGDHATTGTS
ncbi:hypothetical protein AGRA3207_007523 [Actinomadura graeca]|uniref:Uncharacterized protein n=1 Tax=Actinomadura graeca TaxID=2750812 RepID=A0ABX8R6B2_9ACTN|nr:hypothetical protein [Actinomadura graeca]QXJ25954.1 hypothetical protein AGRA3207_007523 [Actinomadura graeca]